VQQLIKKGLNILVVEPNIDKHPDFSLVDYDTAKTKSDLLIRLVNHKEFVNKKDKMMVF